MHITRKYVRGAARRLLGPGSQAGFKVRARRCDGFCTVTVTRRSRTPAAPGARMILGRAATWAKALRQLRSGYAVEA
jgi:hypothetical protein